eukprot:4582815-Pyramimonas_sp.AAC.1
MRLLAAELDPAGGPSASESGKDDLATSEESESKLETGGSPAGAPPTAPFWLSESLRIPPPSDDASGTTGASITGKAGGASASATMAASSSSAGIGGWAPRGVSFKSFKNFL